MAEALAKYKEVKAELSAPPAKKVCNQILDILLNYYIDQAGGLTGQRRAG